MGIHSAYKTLRRWQKLTLWTGVFFIVYTVFGFFIFPRILQSVSADKLTQLLGRPTTIEKITFNPYSLFLTLDKLTIAEKQSADRFFSIDQARMNLQAASILKLGPVVREITIDGLFFNAIRHTDQTYNFSDLIPGPLAGKTTPASEENTLAPSPLRFSISNIVLTNGTIMVNDLPKHKIHQFTEMNLAIPFISNLDVHTDIFVTPYFSVKFNGSPIRIEGESKPFIASRITRMELNLEGIDLPTYYAYLPFQTHMDLTQGTLNLSCSIEFLQSQTPQALPGLFLTGDFRVSGLKITDLNAHPIFEMEDLTLSLDRSEVMKGDINIKELIVSSPLMDLRLDDSNRLNIYRLLPENKTNDKTNHADISSDGPAGRSFPVQLTCGRVEINNTLVTLTDPSEKKDVFSLQQFGLDDIGLDTANRLLTVQKVSAGDGRLNVYRLFNEQINLEAMAPPPSSQADKDTSNGWNARVENISVQGIGVTATDLVSKQKGEISLEEIFLNSSGFSTLSDTKSDSTLSFIVNQKGRVEMSGQWGIHPLQADMALNADQIHLAWSQAFISEYVNLILSGGILSTSGRMVFEQSEKNPLKASYAGDINISDFLVVDSRNADDLIQFKQLGIKDMMVEVAPLSLKINTLKLTEPVSSIVVYSDGSLNFSKIARSSKALETTPESSEKTAADDRVPVKIGQVILENGQVFFTDNAITPQFKTRLTQVHATVKGLSSEETIQSDLDVKAMVNNHTPIAVTGKINPLKSDFFCDMTVTCSGMDLGFLSPYAGRYAGYNIQKGKLSLDLEYLVDRRTLNSKNDLFLDQFDFGEKVDSKDAIKAPVTLAVSLLKDPAGRIALNLPVKGSLDDPEFSIAGIVIKMIVNLLVKAATAPFSLLGSMFGGGEDLDIIVFEPGQHDITPQAAEKVEILVKALSQRPALNLEISGYVNENKDRPALLNVKMDQLLKAEKLKSLVRQGYPGIPVDQVELTDEEYELYLKSVFDQTEEGMQLAGQVHGVQQEADDSDTHQADEPAEPEKTEEQPEITREQMITIVQKDIQVTDDDLKHLAGQRSLAVKDAILLDGSIDSKRVFTVQTRTLEPQGGEKTTDSGCVIMTLK